MLRGLFSKGGIVSKGLDLIDETFSSDEERSANKIELLKAYHPFKRMQRRLATFYVVNFFACFWAILWLKWQGIDTDFLSETIGEFWIGEAMLAIVAFYFGGGFAESVGRARKE